MDYSKWGLFQRVFTFGGFVGIKETNQCNMKRLKSLEYFIYKISEIFLH